MSSNNLLIVGLGNPDKDYEGSRHNCGADYVKFLSDRIKITLSIEDKFFALYGSKKIEKKNIHLCIPTVYVNESGQTVSAIKNYLKLSNIDILIVHDELDLPLGKIKLKEVQCRTALGFVWINLDDNPQEFEEALSPLLNHLRPYQPERFIRVLNLTCEVDCNWKIIHDNFNESYHLPTLHPELSVHIENNYKFSQFDMYENGHNRMLMPGHKPALGNESPNDVQFPLDEALKAFKLKFLGFEIRDKSTLSEFRKFRQNSNALTSLSLWHKFELDNPDTFIGMYQFWCQKS